MTDIQAMRDLVTTQGRDGNWDYDPYMHGLYNGMEMMLAMCEGREPQYRGTPVAWLSDIPQQHPPIDAISGK